MAHYLRALRAEDTAEGVMSFVASTPGVKRDGMEIDQAAWDLAAYESNPVVLWAHDYSALPIGRASVRTDGERLLADVEFDTADEFASRVRDKYERGFLNAVSVGWRDVEGEDETTHELLDISAVPVPGDPDALAERQRSAVRDLARAMLDETDDPVNDLIDGTDAERCAAMARLPDSAFTKLSAEDIAELRWQETAAAMVDALTPRSDESEDERRERYNALLPEYRRLGKTAPEWVPDERLYLLGVDTPEWRGLFLEGEVEPNTLERAALGKRDQNKLTKAIGLIQQVLDAMQPKDEDNAKDEERTVVAEYDRLLNLLAGDDNNE